jgi:hypothetical protein
MSATGAKPTPTSFLRSSLLLAGCVGVVALLLAPFAMRSTGSAGFGGLALAASICLAACWAAELAIFSLGSHVSPLSGMLLGMAIRMVPPLGVCVALAAQGANGRQHLAFIGYLLAFYLVTLALETWLTVHRVASASGPAGSTVS